jgi:transposase
MKSAKFERLWAAIEPQLPKDRPKPKGGRPRVSDRQVLRGILFVLETGIPWARLPKEMGCGSGMTCWRRLKQWQAQGVWDKLHGELLSMLNTADSFDWQRFSIDSGSVPSPRGAKRRARTRPTEAKGAPSAT